MRFASNVSRPARRALTALSISGLVASTIVLGGGGAQAASLPKCDSMHNWYPVNVNDHSMPYPARNTEIDDCLMSQGAHDGSGIDAVPVRSLQESLKLCYGRNIALDGDFGPATRSALVYAQQQAGVTADGIYGPKTRHAMKWPLVSNPFKWTGFTSCSHIPK